MFDAVRTNRKFVQIVLAVILLPFALWGILGEFNKSGSGSNNLLAKIGDRKITDVDLSNRVRQLLAEREGLKADQPGLNEQVLDLLIDEAVVNATARENGLSVSRGLVEDAYRQEPAFQEDGKFSGKKAEYVLKNAGMTAAAYENRVATDVMPKLLLLPLMQSTELSKTTLARWVSLSQERRTLAEWKFDAAKFTANVKLPADDAQKFYDANKTKFETTERVKAEYVVLDVDAFAKQVVVSDAEVQKWYESHQKDFVTAEERRASHILIGVDAKAKPEERAAAKKRAEALQAQVKANPQSFAKLAKENSSDSSAQQGGDLGFFAKGAMVPEFDAATFALKPGQISTVIETKFGFHIIQLTEVRGGKVRTLAEVKPQIVAELQKQGASKRLAESAEVFGNLVYEQADSYKAVTEKLGLVVQKTDWLDRSGRGAVNVLANPKVQTALFSTKSVQEKKNSEAIDLGKGTFVSVRVVDYQAKQLRPFKDVQAEIQQQLVLTKAELLSQETGEAQLAKLKSGAEKGEFGAIRTITRNETPSNEVRQALFAKADKFPAYVGVKTPDGYSIYRLDGVTRLDVKQDDPQVAALGQQLTSLYAMHDMRSTQQGLRNSLKVKTYPEHLPKKTGTEE